MSTAKPDGWAQPDVWYLWRDGAVEAMVELTTFGQYSYSIYRTGGGNWAPTREEAMKMAEDRVNMAITMRTGGGTT